MLAMSGMPKLKTGIVSLMFISEMLWGPVSQEIKSAGFPSTRSVIAEVVRLTESVPGPRGMVKGVSKL